MSPSLDSSRTAFSKMIDIVWKYVGRPDQLVQLLANVDSLPPQIDATLRLHLDGRLNREETYTTLAQLKDDPPRAIARLRRLGAQVEDIFCEQAPMPLIPTSEAFVPQDRDPILSLLDDAQVLKRHYGFSGFDKARLLPPEQLQTILLRFSNAATDIVQRAMEGDPEVIREWLLWCVKFPLPGDELFPASTEHQGKQESLMFKLRGVSEPELKRHVVKCLHEAHAQAGDLMYAVVLADLAERLAASPQRPS